MALPDVSHLSKIVQNPTPLAGLFPGRPSCVKKEKIIIIIQRWDEISAHRDIVEAVIFTSVCLTLTLLPHCLHCCTILNVLSMYLFSNACIFFCIQSYRVHPNRFKMSTNLNKKIVTDRRRCIRRTSYLIVMKPGKNVI